MLNYLHENEYFQKVLQSHMQGFIFNALNAFLLRLFLNVEFLSFLKVSSSTVTGLFLVWSAKTVNSDIDCLLQTLTETRMNKTDMLRVNHLLSLADRPLLDEHLTNMHVCMQVMQNTSLLICSLQAFPQQLMCSWKSALQIFLKQANTYKMILHNVSYYWELQIRVAD